MMSLSAKPTHWRTWAPDSRVAPRRSSLATGGREGKKTGAVSGGTRNRAAERGEGDFNGNCILYGVSRWNASSRSLGVTAYGSISHCTFVDGVSVLIAVYCFCTAFYLICAYFLGGATRSICWLTCCLAIAAAFLLLLLTCGCMIRVGFSSFCQTVMKQTTIKSCSEAEKLNWTSPIRSCRFNQYISHAETVTWVNFFMWLVIVLLLVVQRMGGRVPLLSGADSEYSTAVSGTSETDHLIPSGPTA
ncbi:transmembrane protein 179B-like [Rhinoraja longicauda]